MKYMMGPSQANSMSAIGSRTPGKKNRGQSYSNNESGHSVPKALATCLPTLLFFVFSMILSFAAPVLAQSTFGSVRGTIQDNTSANIADAQVVLHSMDENTERTASADASGAFIF